MKPALLAAACLGLVVVPFAACDDSLQCTLAGCQSTLELRIEVADGGRLPDASYEIVVELDGIPYVTACGQPQPGMFACEPVEGPAAFVVEANPYTDGSAIGLTVWADEGEGDGPQRVRLTVVSGDAPLVDTTTEPTYETRFPNGEACGPSCVQGEQITATFARP